MEFSQTVIEKKRRYASLLPSLMPSVREVVEKYEKDKFEIKRIRREWEPGGGSFLFQVQTDERKIFLKVMNLEITVESKLEGEKSFMDIPSIRNEFNYISDIGSRIGSRNIPEILFYEERENHGFLAMEWLETFDSVISAMNIRQLIQTYSEIRHFTRSLFDNNIVHTDIHENNIRFRDNVPVFIDFGETREFHQKLSFERSLDYTGSNRYGNLGNMPQVDSETVRGYTCLQRLKRVFDMQMIEKLFDFSKECKFDDKCAFNKDELQQPDSRIYQSIHLGNLQIMGQRPEDDERESVVRMICYLFSMRYLKLIYLDIGSNIGKFCLEMSKLKRVIKSVGIEAFENYLIFAEGLRFILNAKKTSFYNLIFGIDDISENVQELRHFQNVKKFVSLMSVYHHLENKERCLDHLRKISPVGMIVEFATQERYYPERQTWEREVRYLKDKLNFKYALMIYRSEDYRRPIVLYTSDLMLYALARLVRIYMCKRVKSKSSSEGSTCSHRKVIDRVDPGNMEMRPESLTKAIKWLASNRATNGGISISDKQQVSYPEVSGYTIPTLYQWGEKEFARSLTAWLMRQQNEDGSFSAPDGIPYTFDTGQVIRGLLPALDEIPALENNIRRACNWVMSQIQKDGRLDTPSVEMWSNKTDDRIHLYVLPPLIEAGKKIGEQKYFDAAERVLDYYRSRDGLVEFDILSHFYAYIIEALCDLGERDLASAGMSIVSGLQREDGSIPAYRNVSWVCLPGQAQLALIWIKLGMRERGVKALQFLCNNQNASGGFYGSCGQGANYFANEEISWAVKYFLDASYWQIKSEFERQVDIYSNYVEENDGRAREVLSFIGDLNGKKLIDVGCGKGRFLRILKSKYEGAKLYGLDISEEMLKFCPEGVEKVCGSILDIQYPDDYFDCVICVEALEHAIRTDVAIREMVRILKPGGKIIIIDKNIDKRGVMELKPWEQWFDPEEITELLSEFGIKAHYNYIPYEQKMQPDGLFVSWRGTKQ